MNAPVTRRFPLLAVTRRWLDAPAAAVTLRYAEAAVDERGLPPPGEAIGRGALILEGYRVEEGPLGGSTGEGEVYRCTAPDGETVAVKLYRRSMEPKKRVLAELRGLAHPHIVRLLAVGNWEGRFFEVMEHCSGGALSDAVPLDEAGLHRYLPQLLAGLDYCHRRGIIHRDIKPNNLFFATPARAQVKLGDFGISSYVDQSELPVRVTQTAAQLTLDYAAPELLDGHQVSTKTDFYALGLTLLHLLLGRSPFAGLSPNDILVAHLRGRAPIPEGISGRIRNLLRGLIHYDPRSRWGIREVRDWAEGADPPLPRQTAAPGARQAYPGFPAATTLCELAANLHAFDAERQFLRGDIRRWVFDHFDGELGERIEALEQAYARRPEQGLVRLRWLLDPRQPLRLEDGTLLEGIPALAAQLARDPEPLYSLWDNAAIETWIEAGKLAGVRTKPLLQKIRRIRERLGTNRRAALSALLFTLAPSRPLRIAHNQLIRHPSELGTAFAKVGRPVLIGLKKLLFDRTLEEWIRAAEFDQWASMARFLERTRKDYFEKPALGAYCVLWYFVPRIPFPVEDQRFTRARDLAHWIAASERNTKRGLHLLEKGWLRAWLVGTRQMDRARLDPLLLTLDMSDAAKLEALLALWLPELERPQWEVHPRSLVFGTLKEGERRERTLQIYALGRGHLFGHIELERYGEGIGLSAFRIDGRVTEIKVTLDAVGLAEGRYQNRLTLHTKAGEREVAVFYNIKPREQGIGDWLDRLLE